MANQRTVYLSAGHSNVPGRDRGAAGNGYIEGVEAVRIRNQVAKNLRQIYNMTSVVDPDDSILSQTIAWFKNKTTKDCLVIDIHFNSATPTATGTETFVPDDASLTELQLAYCLSHSAHDRMKIPKRGNFKTWKGVKPESESQHKKLGFMRLTGENALIEVCFISNPNDMKAYEREFENYCRDLAYIIYKFSVNEQNEIINKIAA